ncbi:hypothetical protein EN858_21440 [Mesorhizobium sp. M4B.F.Ca.ET.215.01.1.1]|uniref:hypothetical protein n=2 Tax=Mesorhizobium TaxID=68287 RepID=UPI001091C2A8|nr:MULTISPECIES: hypothetical protein [unclassified Mesorhizobium]TIT29652.1 MAG: hypothetical protein E5W86_01635 [Mesorhizobium sp.]TGQ09313.1 hypothetical protein EN858_21440 [Mesorhizobium sp. M4B.F.Ca.ET.215.01.1.1]TGQ27298.1 hypothetical protein EN863_049325 [Mesorhizobium sp. M00.F.Ca.ET.220.01.1.1]TGQ27885.1 hypothetical protein EN857_32425 [Mesorhizobium sp. M4B.F.Ca.ET.214.01.1.1]TGQ54963.1 hypothetical protein EN854_32310 [Mesorhizobium sp. M4B.F.Ca.ET.211.01.1.1]
MDQRTIDSALVLLRQYRDILVMSYAPIGPSGVPETRTPAQAADPIEIAALEDIASLDAVIKEMST